MSIKEICKDKFVLSRREFIKLSLFLAITKTVAKDKSKNALLYYSRTLNTHILAQYIATVIKADVYRIHTLNPYPKDYDEMLIRARKEQEKRATVALEDIFDLNTYDNIILGSPLWSLNLSTPIRSFLKSANIKNKNISAFISNAGYSVKNALDEIQELSKENTHKAFLSYTFKHKEKTKRDLKTYNEALLQDKTKLFTLLQEDTKLQTFIRNIQ